MTRENVEHLQSVVETSTCGNFVTEHNFLAVVVRAHVEKKCTGRSRRSSPGACFFATQRIHSRSAAARPKDGPTREASRNFRHILMRLTTVEPACLQYLIFCCIVIHYVDE